jgi:hypothetical protein
MASGRSDPLPLVLVHIPRTGATKAFRDEDYFPLQIKIEKLRKSSRETSATAAKPLVTLQAFALRYLDALNTGRVI